MATKESKARTRRYREDPEYRERLRANARKLYAKNCAENPDYRARRLRNQRARLAARRDEINAAQRQRYAADAEYRETRYMLRVRREYGLSPKQYDAMLARQQGVCAVCRQASRRRLVVDHCHRTGKVRGLLCRKCNFAIGLCGDDPRLTREATAYLEASLAAGQEQT